MRGSRATARAIAAFVCALLVGCGGAPPPPPPTVASVALAAATNVNPDAGGAAAPVAVRVYQLASTATFDTADFFQLYQNDQSVLGADMLGREEVVLAPGAAQQLTVEMKPGAKFIGVVAAFRDIQNAKWRGSAAPPANQTSQVQISVNGLNVDVVILPPSGGS